MRAAAFVVLFSLALLCVPVSVDAQSSSYTLASPGDRPGVYTFIFAGRTFGGNAFDELEEKGTMAYGAGFTVLGSHLLSLEFEVAYCPGFLGTDPILGTTSAATLTGGVLVGPWIGRFRPYVVASGGLLRARVEAFQSVGLAEAKDVAVVAGGAGFMVMFSPRLGLRGDGRYHRVFGSTRSNDGWDGLDGITYMTGSIGLTFAF